MGYTLERPIQFEGVALHSGSYARIVVRPGDPASGICFVRCDLSDAPVIPARAGLVRQSPLCTELVQGVVRVSTIEHLMAAFHALDLTDLRIEIDGPEVPILDGTALPFFRALAPWRRPVSTPIAPLRVARPIAVSRGDRWMRIEPFDGYEITAGIAFEDEAIGRQLLTWNMDTPAGFAREIGLARTFCRASDVATMQSAGRALGGSLDNAIVVDGARIVTPGGLRIEREFVRHKILDIIGDMALAGRPIRGRISAWKPGHGMTNDLLRALLEDRRTQGAPAGAALVAV